MVVSPPFNINESIPGDTDIVSQHPANARTFRDVVESWLLVNHNVQGRHDEAQLDWKADPGSGVSGVTELWASSSASGRFKYRRGTGNVEHVGVPPGMVIAYAGVIGPITEGWLLANGAAVSRTTYADLFAAIGTIYGIGDGSTTFNLPDLRGRTIAGEDLSAGRLTGASLAVALGLESHTLTIAQMPSHDHGGVTGSGGTHHHTVGFQQRSDVTITGAAGLSNLLGGGSTVNTTDDGAHTHSVAAQGGGGSHNNVQPTLTLNWLIKT